MKKLHLIKNYLVNLNIMNNLSDKNVIIIILITVFLIFGLIFSVKSPERKVIDSPLIWKDNYTQSYKNNDTPSDNFI